MDSPGTRLQLSYRATTPGHGDIDEKTGATKSRLVEPVAWLNNCHLRIFLAQDGHKYRVSGIEGNAVVFEREKMKEKDSNDGHEDA